jgi:ferrochelatase
VTDVVLVPLGFVSDHVEVLYDLDVEAQAIAGEVGMHLVRARTVGADPRYAAMIVDLFLERQAGGLGRLSLGDRGAPHDICLATCCPNLRHPETPAIAQAD